MGVPEPAEMSIPSCIRHRPARQRYPNPLTTGPLTGQMNPLEETAAGAGAEEGDGEEDEEGEEDEDNDEDTDCEARIWDPSCALTSWRASASAMASSAVSWACAAAPAFSLRAAASAP